MKLITTGCSFATPPENGHSWSIYLGELLKIDSVISFVMQGVSNEYMNRNIIKSVIDNLNDELIVVVGWTSINRWENFTDKYGEFHISKVIETPINFYLSDFEKKEYKQHLLNYSLFQEHMKKLNMIITLGEFLNSKNIRYVFFNAFEKLDDWKYGNDNYGPSETGPNCKLLNPLTDYIKKHINFLDKTQIEIANTKEYFIDDGWHPSDFAHKKWSNVLYNYLGKLL